MSDLIRFNVGGTILTTTLSKLQKVNDNLLERLLSEKSRNPDSCDKDGNAYIDRDPDIFRYVMRFLTYYENFESTGQYLSLIDDNYTRSLVKIEFEQFGIIKGDLSINKYIQKPKNIDFNDLVRHSILTDMLSKSQIVNFTVLDNLLISRCLSEDLLFLWDCSTYSYAEIVSPFRYNMVRKIRTEINSLTTWYGLIFMGLNDGSIKIYDFKKNCFMRTLEGHDDKIFDIIIHNNHIFSGSLDCNIKIWDTHTGECLNTLKGHSGGVVSLCILDDKTIASGSFDFTIKIWDIDSGKEVQTLHGHKALIRCMISLKNRLVSASHDYSIRIWNLATRNCMMTIRVHNAGVTGLTIIDDQHFASCSTDSTIRLWNISSISCVKILDTSDGVTCLKFYKNAIFAGLFNGNIEVWKIKQ